MFVFLVLLYFLVACLAGWLLLFPGGRVLLLASVAGIGARLGRRASHVQRGGLQGLALCRTHGQGALTRAWRGLRAHRWLALASVLLLVLPPLLAWLGSGRNMLGGFDTDGRMVNQQVSELLKGEQLVPPVALPPLVFTTQEVVLVRPMLASASRDWERLDHDFSQRLLLVFQIMKRDHGYDMALLEGYRSPERQNLLAAAGSSVTNARAFQSYHQFGLAADCAFLRDGKLVITEKDAWAMRGYQLYGAAAESVGLHWGGRWTMMDFGHVELRVAGTVRK